jgi:hypothetical protein
MGKMIYAGSKCKNPKKKPGWRDAAAQEAEWLKSINSMKLFSSPGKKYQGAKVVPGKKVTPVVEGTLPTKQRLETKLGESLNSFGGVAGKKVIRPEILYKEDPELAERERIARERKFNTAPAYNKGGDVFVTEEELANQLRGNKRRV